MGKKQKKLTDEEIEKHKHETYQMMAAMSGKQVSELMGELSSRPNFSENYCLIKQLYLKNCAEPISSKELFKTLKNQGYKAKYSTFRGLLNNYQKYGYICKVNAKKPFLYVLTDEGRVHATDPFIKVDENIKRHRELLYNQFIDLINEDPEQFKAIYESIFGTQNSIFPAGTPISGGSQYSPNDIGSELQQELESQIFTPDFIKNADEGKLKSLVDCILDNSLSDEQKKQLILDVIDQARTNKTMIFKQQEYNSKPTGERKYYSLLANSNNQPVTRSLYEAIPFRFIKVGNDIRLKGVSESGTYKNNQDGVILDFDYVNRTYFYNLMIIKSKPNHDKKELEFYYVGGKFGRLITTMSFTDYEKAKNVKQQTLKINTN